MIKKILVISVLLLVGNTTGVMAAPERVALVLGGGGARGAAHIGVLEVLEQERIPVDCVVGTSMGGLVAGSYAAGLSPKMMRKKLAQADWTDIFLDLADYSQLSYRQKRVSRRYLAGTQIGLSERGFQIQPGVVSGEKIKLFFNQLVDEDLGERNIEQLAIPLAIIATDIGTGERVVFREGSLTQAMRASMSVPGLMAPVEYRGRKLVDGGLVDNVPVQVARDLCAADRVIVVNVGSPLKAPDEIGSLLGVSAQMIGILTKQNVAQSLSTLTGADIYIAPELGDIKATDFARYEAAAATGRIAAEKQRFALRELSVSVEDYALWSQQRRHSARTALLIDDVVIAPTKRVHPEYVARHIQQQPKQPLDRAALEQDLLRTYGDGYYDTVDYRVVRRAEHNTLEIMVREKDWGSDYFTFGFAIDNEYRQGSSFNVRGAYRNTWLNRYGGEFFAAIDLGGKPSTELNFYQPLTPRQTFFIEPLYYRKRESIGVYDDERQLAEYKLDVSYAELTIGKNLGVYGQSKLGWRNYRTKGEADISAVVLPNVDEHYGGFIYELMLDRRNRLYFPSHGWRADFTYFDSPSDAYKKLTMDLGAAYKVDQFVIGARAAHITSLNGELPIYDAVMLGGFLNMSGYASNQILGDDAFYAHLRAERIVGRMPLGLNGDLRLGVGVEGARIDRIYTFVSDEKWLDSGVIYLGGETPLGPLYLGYGFTFSGNYNFYLQLGAL